MNLSVILINGLWTALSAAGISVTCAAPARYLVPAFVCGFVGRCLRDVLMGWGLSLNWATLIAVAVLVVVAVTTLRRHTVSPVVLISAILPLGATLAMFNLVLALMQVSSSKGEALSAASDAMTANLGKVFATTLAVAIGLALGLAIARLLGRLYDGASRRVTAIASGQPDV